MMMCDKIQWWFFPVLCGWLGGPSLVRADESAANLSAPSLEKPRINLDTPTFGGMQFWTDELVFHDWRIQRHAVTGHYRLLDEKNIRRAWGDYAACSRELEQIRRDKQLPPLKPRVVLLLHGLVRSRESMESLCGYLRKHGDYSVLNVSYASTRGTLEEHAQALAKIIQHLDGVSETNFVGHSLGNLIVRYYLNDRAQNAALNTAIPRLGRVVMLAPPNNGAQMARRFQDNSLFQTVWGVSGKQLATNWDDLQAHLAVPNCEFGIIAGGKGDQDGRNPLIAGDDDFVVGVDETRLAGATDFLVLPVLHGTIMSDEKVQQCTLQFLRAGFFVGENARRPISVAEPPHD
jgi:pimeloyl-ACP methyl ester carboxylesterase